jgi:hypothetical protein
MKRNGLKTANDVIVADADAGMRKLQEATRQILSIPKTASGRTEQGKARRRKK